MNSCALRVVALLILTLAAVVVLVLPDVLIDQMRAGPEPLVWYGEATGLSDRLHHDHAKKQEARVNTWILGLLFLAGLAWMMKRDINQINRD